jgi:ABC-2 type transport system ATP-binding protein
MRTIPEPILPQAIEVQTRRTGPVAVALRAVTKTFGQKVAVRDLDLVIPQGSLHGFIGPNGAGKTTTIRMIMSIIFPDRGDIEVLGKASAVESKDRIGYLPEERGLYKKMRVGPFLKYMARLKGMPGEGLERRVRAWLERVGLAAEYRKKCEELSKGMQQKVQFIAAIIHEPDLLILDEPFSGLDPMNARMLRELIQEQHDQGRTIIFSTHQMSQAEALCDRIVMIHQGDKVLDNSPDEIQSRFDPRAISMELAAPASDLRAITGIPEVSSVRLLGRDGEEVDEQRKVGLNHLAEGVPSRTTSTGAAPQARTVEVHLRDGVHASSAIPRLAAAMPCNRIQVVRPTLEDVFISIVQGDMSREEQKALRESLKSDVKAPAMLGAGRGDQGGD